MVDSYYNKCKRSIKTTPEGGKCPPAGESREMEEKIRLLLADPSENFRVILQELLEENGFEVLASVGDGLAALDAARRVRPQVVVMELILQKLDGLELLPLLAGMENAPRVLVVSQWTGEDAVREALERGAAYFVPKPCDLWALMARIRDVAAYRCARENSGGTELRAQRIVARTLYALGMSPASSGTELARAMVLILLRDPEAIRQIDRALYRPFLRPGRRSTGYIEHALRYAIREAWTRNPTALQKELFYSAARRGSGCPSNGMFLAVVAEYVRMQLRELSGGCAARQ